MEATVEVKEAPEEKKIEAEEHVESEGAAKETPDEKLEEKAQELVKGEGAAEEAPH